MNISIFDVSGPVMIGPSSSHTAGAAKLARTAALIAAKPFLHISFALHGSFAKTGRGHGTHEALLAGALGLAADDERLPHAFDIAAEKGISYEFCDTNLPDAHENSARISFTFQDASKCIIEGSSIGGGRIIVTKVDELSLQISAESPTLIITQRDRPGVVSEISSILAQNAINIGLMRVSREAKGNLASTVIETDSKIPPAALTQLMQAENVISVKLIDATGGNTDV